MAKANLGLVKAINYNLIWDYFLKNNISTIPIISDAIGLSLPTVTRAIDFGINVGMVNVDEIADSTGGRKARKYSLNSEYMYFLLMIFDNERLYFEVRNFVGDVIKKDDIYVTHETLIVDFENLIKSLKSEFDKIKSASISIPGVIDNGVIVDFRAIKSLNGFNLKKHLEDLFEIDVIVENNVKALTIATKKYDNDYMNKTIITSSFAHNGYGFGFLINGKVLKGAKSAAGEVSYAPSPGIFQKDEETYYQYHFRTIISIFNPDLVVLYSGDKLINFRKVITDVAANLPAYMVPKFIIAKSFTEDSFEGLNILCIEMVKLKISAMPNNTI